jgi:succinoglycan biosynthesis transport protein ExoP
VSAPAHTPDIVPPRLLAAVREMTYRVWLARGMSAGGSLVLLSAKTAEGRTTLALALSVVLAELPEAEPVLLVDCDFHRPALDRRLSLHRAPGLAEVLRGELALPAAVQPTEIPNLSLLAAGEGGEAAARLLAPPMLANLLERARATYRAVVLDTTAAADSPSGFIAASQADRALLVVQANRTSWREAAAMRDELKAAGDKLLGVILNRHQDFLPGFLRGA